MLVAVKLEMYVLSIDDARGTSEGVFVFSQVVIVFLRCGRPWRRNSKARVPCECATCRFHSVLGDKVG